MTAQNRPNPSATTSSPSPEGGGNDAMRYYMLHTRGFLPSPDAERPESSALETRSNRSPPNIERRQQPPSTDASQRHDFSSVHHLDPSGQIQTKIRHLLRAFIYS